MQKYLTMEGFVIATAAVLVLTFYMFYAINVSGRRDLLTELILIIIEITLLGIFALLGKIEYLLEKKR
jgi:CDP-diglyceride synthetase